MRRALAALFLLAAAAGGRAAAEVPAALAAPIPFLARAPRIDGLLDESLAALPARPLPPPERSAAENPATEATFRLAWGAGFLWLHVESPGEALAFRDRAFQNGDGLHLVLALPRPDGAPSTEFTVVAVSAVDRPAMDWTRRVAWYRGPDRVFVPLSPAAQAATAAKNGRLGFELLLPRSDVAPLHPWLSPAIGFNLAVVRAVGAREKNVHLLVPDRFVDSEGKPRLSAPLTFEAPRSAPRGATFVALPVGHLRAGEPLRATVVGGPGADDAATLRVRTAEGTLVAVSRAAIRCADAPCREEVEVDAGDFLPGGYRVEWTTREAGLSGESPLTVLPRLEREEAASRLARLAPSVSPGTKATIELLVDEAEKTLRALPRYEAAGRERLALEEAAALLRRAESGEEPLAERRGAFRRAFRSRRDGTLQPYALRVPKGGAAGTKRPLLLWLHGSGSDERALFSAPDYSGGATVDVAPRGRGASHAWATPEALADVDEALDDALAATGADPARVVLAGFSMGGYGVYRKFLDAPERFRALAVFSGHPDLANRWTGTKDHPSLFDPAVAARFRGVRLFVFHGAKDRNTPFELTEQAVAALRAAGAEVELAVEDEAGHEAPSPATLARFRAWLARVLASP